VGREDTGGLARAIASIGEIGITNSERVEAQIRVKKGLGPYLVEGLLRQRRLHKGKYGITSSLQI
jgi:hypothetical protein